MDVSICILNRDQRTLLKECLTSCVAELELSKLQGEIVVVDNGSRDGSPEMVAEAFPKIHLFRNREDVGFSAGNNQAIRVSSGRYVLILNNDTLLLPGCLRTMVAFMDEHPQVAVAGPKLLNPDGSVQHHYHRRRLPTLAEALFPLFWLSGVQPGRRILERSWHIDESLNEPTPIERIAGCAMMLRSRALQSAGLFDESFDYFFEDVELCHRLLKSGWSIYYLPQPKIIHYGGATFTFVGSAKHAMHFAGQLRYFRKHKGPLQFSIVKGMTTVTVVLKLFAASALAFIPTKRARHRWSAKHTAYRHLLRKVWLGHEPSGDSATLEWTPKDP